MTVVWNYPTRILFGVGSVAEIGSEVERIGGKHALIVTDPGIVEAGLVEHVKKGLKKEKIAYTSFSGISGNPLEKEALAAADAFSAANADIVVAIGGGSSLDVGKIVRLLASHAPPLSQYDDADDGSDRIVAAVPPMIAIPTTAGTGSEV